MTVGVGAAQTFAPHLAGRIRFGRPRRVQMRDAAEAVRHVAEAPSASTSAHTPFDDRGRDGRSPNVDGPFRPSRTDGSASYTRERGAYSACSWKPSPTGANPMSRGPSGIVSGVPSAPISAAPG